jgi:uncharacterized RDD family membrane protein YckC
LRIVQQLAEINLSSPTTPGDASTRPSAPLDVSKLEFAHPARRVIAIVLDFLFFSWFVIGVKSILCLAMPPANLFFAIVSTDIFVLFLLIGRDWLFGGRGLGKQLMRLRTVDEDTHQPVSLKQSIIRNSLLFGTCLIFQIATFAVPESELWSKPFVVNSIGFGSSCFVVVAFIIETILMSIPGGERLGDGLAKTVTYRDTSECRSNF